ncbi:MAG: rhodanese-like domain-containing protein [Actinomycetota bacterium]|nr:rhodanese-like domain-containing protein [Actinomycetota bacterium]
MPADTPDRIDGTTLQQWLRQPRPVTLLDVRSPAEFEAVRIPGSINAPLNLVEKHAGPLAERLDRQVVLVCQSGVRATQAQQRLAGAGAEHLHVLDGGVSAFASAGGEVLRGRPRWSLERQVRLVAGSLVLGSLLASLRTPKAGLLGAGVGAGLTISALTDTCTMGRVLSALPYNRSPQPPSAAEVLAQLPEPQQSV